MKHTNAFTKLFLLMILVISASAAFSSPKLISAKPRYVSIVDVKGSGKTVSVIFDERRGTGRGYDILYIDSNCNGKFEASEKYAVGRLDDDFYYFPVVHIPAFAGKNQKSVDLSFEYTRYPKPGNYSITIDITYRNGSMFSLSDNMFSLSDKLKPSTNPTKPYVLRFYATPTLNIHIKPANLHTELALTLNSGSGEFDSEAFTADISIADKNGKVIKKDKGTLYKFGFG